MKKKLELVVEDTCYNCPYSRYDGFYSMSHDSGFDCSHSEAKAFRIADDWEIKEFEEKVKEYKNSASTLFPIVDFPSNPMRIPGRCPLPNA